VLIRGTFFYSRGVAVSTSQRVSHTSAPVPSRRRKFVCAVGGGAAFTPVAAFESLLGETRCFYTSSTFYFFPFTFSLLFGS
jgi:hypothetical protein